MKFDSGVFEGPYSFKSRFESEKGTNLEELIAPAHAGFLSMALSLGLGQASFTPDRIHTTAKVRIEKSGNGKITHIGLDTAAEVPGIDAAQFSRQAEAAK